MFDAFDADLMDDSDEEFLLNANILESVSSKRLLNNLETQDSTNKRFCGEVTDEVKQNSTSKDYDKKQQTAKRKFAGPAGLLPNLAFEDLNLSSESRIFTSYGLLNEDKTSDRRFELISNGSFLESQQNSTGTAWFEGQLWFKYKQDMNSSSENNIEILEKFNVSWILKKVKRNINFTTKKIPFLSVILTSVTSNEADSHSVVFRDPSGNIEGSIHHRVMEKFRFKLQPGSVLVLHQFSVFSPSPRKHYLCITENNVVRIYFINDEGSVDCEEVKSLSWFELAKDAEQSFKEIYKEKLLKEQNGAFPAVGNNKSGTSNSTKTYSLITPENYKRKEIHSPYIQNNALERPANPNTQPGNNSSILLSSPVIQSLAMPKKFTFKKTNQDTHATAGKQTNKPDSSNKSLQLDNVFNDDVWNDDDFENLVQDIII